jgi:hypothetical protein
MRRSAQILLLTATLVAVDASAALAHDGGEGWWGETNDKVVTNAGFILIVFFPLFVLFASLLQGALDRRKARRKKIQKSLAREQEHWRGGW